MISHDAPGKPSTEYAVGFIRKKLVLCREQHNDCETRRRFRLPRRVLDLQELGSSQLIRFTKTQSLLALLQYYVTLSHCWDFLAQSRKQLKLISRTDIVASQSQILLRPFETLCCLPTAWAFATYGLIPYVSCRLTMEIGRLNLNEWQIFMQIPCFVPLQLHHQTVTVDVCSIDGLVRGYILPGRPWSRLSFRTNYPLTQVARYMLDQSFNPHIKTLLLRMQVNTLVNLSFDEHGLFKSAYCPHGLSTSTKRHWCGSFLALLHASVVVCHG
jgi:hypothetical protein